MLLAKCVVAVREGDTFTGTLIRYRSWGSWLTLRDAELKGTPVDGLVLIPKANVAFLQVVTR